MSHVYESPLGATGGSDDGPLGASRGSRMRASSHAPTSTHTQTHSKNAQASIIISLERERLRLLDAVARDSAAVKELEMHVAALDENVLNARAKLGCYNALFVRVADADARAPRQRLGAAYSVLGTKRIIEREMDRLQKEAVTTEMKINRSREKNAAIRNTINTLRREHVTYTHLFSNMRAELSGIKRAIAEGERQVEAAYAARDRAFEEMRELVKQFELSKLERAAEFKVYSDMLASLEAQATAALQPRGMHSSVSSVSDSDVARLQERIATANAKAAKERMLAEAAQRKLASYTQALAQVKMATEQATAGDIVNIFNKYEDEKFQKAKMVQRLLSEIERLERDVTLLQEEVQERDDENARVKAHRATALEELQHAADDGERHAQDVNQSVRDSLDEVRALYRIISFAFHALGIESELENLPAAARSALSSPAHGHDQEHAEPTAVSFGATTYIDSPQRTTSFSGAPGRGGSGRGSPVSLRRADSLGIYAADTRVRHAVRGGVSASTLGTFMGIIENRAAEIIQQYAAHVHTMEAEAAASPQRKPALDVPDDATTVDESRAVTANSPDRPSSPVLKGGVPPFGAAGSGEAARRMLAPSVLGPANPTGKTREVLAANALLASMTVDTLRMADDSADAQDDVRPFSTVELKVQASRRLNTDRGIRQLRPAATAAASVLVGTHTAAAAAADDRPL